MAVDVSSEIARNNAAYSDLQNKFESSVFWFESIALDPGNGFDVDYWLAQVETPTFDEAPVSGVTVTTRTVALPAVVPPEFVPPEDVYALALGSYDSEYLEAIEQEVRTLTADILDEVIPVSLYDAYFKVDRANKARAAADAINDIIEKHASRRFPIIPMVANQDAIEVVSKWQDGEYEHQDKTAKERVEIAKKMYFASIDKGISVEDLRSKLILQYARFFSDHNQTLVGYYQQLMNEKLSEARLVLENVNADLAKDLKNVELQSIDNRSEMELPKEVFQRALKRLELDFKIDEEKVERRRQCMQKICDTYAGWAVGVLGQAQGMATARHNVAVET